MKTSLLISAIALHLLLGTSCGNTGFIGHRMAYDINAEVKSDLSSPVSMNVGFESHSGVAVPPRESLTNNQLPGTTNIAKGDVMATVSRLSIERLEGGTYGTEFDYVTATATGQAAINATKPETKESIAASVASPKTQATDALTQIATSTKSINTRTVPETTH
jgi:hypothetical protein